MKKPLLRVRDVMARFGVSYQTVLNWIKRGQINYTRIRVTWRPPIFFFTEADIAAKQKADEESAARRLTHRVEMERRKQKRKRERRAAAGLCQKCPERARPGRLLCLECKAIEAVAFRIRRKRWRAAGLCTWCGKGKAVKYGLCERHAEMLRASDQKRRKHA